MAHAAELQFCQCQVRVLLNVRGMFFHVFPNANGISRLSRSETLAVSKNGANILIATDLLLISY